MQPHAHSMLSHSCDPLPYYRQCGKHSDAAAGGCCVQLIAPALTHPHGMAFTHPHVAGGAFLAAAPLLAAPLSLHAAEHASRRGDDAPSGCRGCPAWR